VAFIIAISLVLLYSVQCLLCSITVELSHLSDNYGDYENYGGFCHATEFPVTASYTSSFII